MATGSRYISASTYGSGAWNLNSVVRTKSAAATNRSMASVIAGKQRVYPLTQATGPTYSADICYTNSTAIVCGVCRQRQSSTCDFTPALLANISLAQSQLCRSRPVPKRGVRGSGSLRGRDTEPGAPGHRSRSVKLRTTRQVERPHLHLPETLFRNTCVWLPSASSRCRQEQVPFQAC